MQSAAESDSPQHNSSGLWEGVPLGLPVHQTRLSVRKRLVWSRDLQFRSRVPLSDLSAFADGVTGGRGFDVLLDLNGGPYFAASLEAMALKGRIILIGGVAGGKTDVDLYQILRKRLHVIGTVLRARSLQEKIAITAVFAEEVVPLLAKGTIQPVIDSVFPLEKCQDAHRRLESNETFGKVVLTIS